MKKILILILIMVFGLNVFSQVSPSESNQQQEQNNTKENKRLLPSEKRKQLKSEKHKKDAQEDSVKHYKDVFGDKDSLFSEMNIPSKWEKESAVIINQKYDFSYLRGNNTVEIEEIGRRRIKLLDKAAVENFSEFYYLGFENNSIYFSGNAEVGIHIIKPNGNEVPVDIKLAVNVNDNSIPDFFKVLYTSKNLSYKKLAIPDLEPGDIIDYYFKIQRSIKDIITKRIGWNFEPFYFTLNSIYPIMNQNISFTVDRGFFINFNSYNGAPPLSGGEAGTDWQGRQRAMIKTYRLVDKDRERRPSDVWQYNFRDNPSVKFQVVYETSASMKSSRNFIGEIGVAKSKVDSFEISEVLGRSILDEEETTFADEILKYLNKYFPKERNPEFIAKESYYFFRKTFLDFYFKIDIPYVSNVSKEDILYISDEKFVSTLLQVFKKKYIDAYIVATVRESIGSIDDVLLRDEMSLGVMLKSNKPIFMFPFSSHSTYDMPEEELQGVNAYIFKLERNGHSSKLEKIKLPKSEFNDNKLSMSYYLNIDSNMENIKAKRETIITGAFKRSFYYRAIYGYDYLKEEKLKYEPSTKPKAQLGDKNNLVGEVLEDTSIAENLKEKHFKILKDELLDDFDIASYENFELISSGRNDDSPVLEFTENFILKDMVSKVSKNYFVNIGKFIGKQIELKEKQMKRTTNYHTDYPRTIINEISLKIPEGYMVDGLTELNFNIDNPAAAFITNSQVEGNNLIIKTTKSYKSISGPKEDWSKLVDVMEAAYKFTQKKIILRKL